MARLEAQPSAQGLTSLPCPVLVADVGGTNARFGVIEAHGGPVRRAPGTASPGTTADRLVADAIDALGVRPASAVLALAGPVANWSVDLTNAGWFVDARALAARHGWRAVVVVNDFAALAAAIPDLEATPGALVPIGPDVPPGAGPRVILGPGTGLGASALVAAPTGHVIVTTEAGHGSTGPWDEEDDALWPLIPRRDGRIMPEALVSGPGLLRLAVAVSRRDGVPLAFERPGDVTQSFEAGDRLAREAVRLFLKYLGRFAGDMAIVFGANGSVAITGGVAEKLAAALHDGTLRAAFENRPPYTRRLTHVPTRFVAAPAPAFLGLAALARDPAGFGIVPGPNLWVP